MTTKTIGIKEFRSKIKEFAQKARKGDVRYVVMNHNTPLFELKPFAENEGLEAIFSDIIKAKDEAKSGKIYSEEDILKEFA